MMKSVIKTSASLMILALALGVGGCTKDKPEWEFMPDMYESTSFKAQKEDKNSPNGAAARVPPAGTIPRDFQPYHYDCTVSGAALAGKELKNPLMRTKMVLERGQKIFNTYCIVCHGAKGDGAGTVVPPYPRPPSLFSEKVSNWADGSIYHVITCGQNLMPTYKTQVQPEDRWAVIHYVRALQRSSNPSAEDIKSMGSEKK